MGGSTGTVARLSISRTRTTFQTLTISHPVSPSQAAHHGLSTSTTIMKVMLSVPSHCTSVMVSALAHMTWLTSACPTMLFHPSEEDVTLRKPSKQRERFNKLP